MTNNEEEHIKPLDPALANDTYTPRKEEVKLDLKDIIDVIYEGYLSPQVTIGQVEEAYRRGYQRAVQNDYCFSGL